MVRATLTGHRPERLGYDKYLYTTRDWRRLIDWLKITIMELKITDAYCGMAHGSDVAYGLAACELKQDGYPIRLHCILPCKNYNSTNPLFNVLKNNAYEWIELAEEFYKGCDNVRDQYMVDHSDKLLVVWDGNKAGGVWSTIRKAQKKGIEIIYYPKEQL